MGAFTEHITHAIAVNTARAPDYADRSRGRSRRVSRALVASERALLPVARWLDRRADLSAAFVSMDTLPPAGAPPRWRSGGGLRARVAAWAALARLGVRAAAHVVADRPAQVVDACRAALCALEGAEARHRVHLAMSRHLVESVGRAAWATSGWRRRGLARLVVGLQLAGLPLAARLDRLAWPAHAAGVGVLVNDLPSIPLSRTPPAPAW